MPFFTMFLVPRGAETTANSEVFEGQVAKFTALFNPTSKNSGTCEVFSNRAA